MGHDNNNDRTGPLKARMLPWRIIIFLLLLDDLHICGVAYQAAQPVEDYYYKRAIRSL